VASSQFDAVARISLDLRAFTAGASQVTRAGGQMEQIFKQLNSVLGKVGDVNKKQAADIARTARAYNQVTSVVRGYVAMIQALSKAEGNSVNATKQMEKAFKGLQSVMSTVRGLGEKEFQRVQRTLTLYTQMATVLQRLAAAQNQMAATTQRSTATMAAEAKERDRAKKAATDQAIAEQRLAQATVKTAQVRLQATQAATLAQERQAQAANRTVVSQNAAAASAVRLSTANQRLAQATAAAAQAQTRATAAAVAANAAQARGASQAAAAQARATQAAAAAAAAQLRLAEAQRRAAAAQRQVNEQLRGGSGSGNLLRQDLSELETAYRRMAQTAVSAVTEVISAGISHESAFAQLARVTKVTGAEADNLKKAFEGLATTEPISFEDVARVGQLAAQTGVATEQLEQFSRTVIRFSVTTGIASDQVTVLFGRIQNMQNLPTQQVSNFASMVLAVGTASAATEDEILKVTQAISTSSTMFGLTTTDIGGLAGALASLRVPPEWSRGTTTRIFRELDDAVKAAGAELGILSNVMNMTGEEVQALRASDPGEFFRQFIKGMQQYTDTSKSAEEATASVANVLKSLGVGAVRDIEFISRLASNFDTLSDLTDKSTIAFSRNSELTEQANILYDTARVKIDNLVDAFEAFLAGVGKDIVVTLGQIASFATDMIEAFSGAPSIVKGMLTAIVAVTAFAAALAALRMIAFQSLRSLVAMRETQARLGVQTLSLRNIYQAYGRTVNDAATANSNATRGYLANIRAATQEASARRASILSLNEQARAAQTSAQASQRLALATVNSARTEIQAIQGRRAAGLTLITDQQRMITQQARMAAGTQRYIEATNQAAAASNRLATAGVTSTSRVSAGMATMAVASRAAAAGVSLLGAALTSIGIGLLIAGITALYTTLNKTSTAARDAAAAAYEAAGGTTALGDAIEADTKAANNGEGALVRLTVAEGKLTEAERAGAEQKRATAKIEQQRIEALFGSIDALRRQAKGTDDAAKRARGYVAEWDAAEKTIQQVTTALGENSFAFSKQAQAVLESTVRQTVMNNEVFKTQGAMKALTENALSVQQAMKIAFEDPAGAAKLLQDEIDRITVAMKAAQELEFTGIVPAESSRSLAEQAAGLQAIKDSLGLVTGDMERAGSLNALFGDTAKEAAGDAEELAAGMDEADAAAQSLATDIQAMSAAIGASLDPMRALDAAFKAANFDSAKEFAEAFRAGKVELDLLNKSFDAFTESITNQLTVTRDWSKNLVRAINELSPAVATAFRDMGIEAAPLLAQALELPPEEKAKFIAEMEAFGKSGQEAFAAAITTGQNAIAGKGAELGRLFADATGNAINQAMKPGGSVAKSAAALEGLADLIERGVITKEVALDLTKFQGDAAKLEALALSLVQSGRLDLTAAAKLVTSLYTGEATALSDWVKGQNAVGAYDLNGDAKLDESEWTAAVARLEAQANLINASDAIDVGGEGKLTTEQYQAELDKLEALVTLTVGSGVLDPNGKANLSPDNFIATMDALETLAKARGVAGDFDANGDGKLDTSEYQRVLEFLKGLAKSPATTSNLSPQGKASITKGQYQKDLTDLTGRSQTWELQAEKYLNPRASVSTRTWDSNLAYLRTSSWTTGSTIQANLTRSATVTVGYTYRQNNSPPRTQQIATGGWVHGEGTATSDSIPAMLSNGEFVINAKQASRFGALLESINNGQYGRGVRGTPPGYATGGRVNVRQVRLRQMQGGSGLIQRMPANSMVPRLSAIRSGGGPSITVNNQYPQAEPTSTTINRSLAYAATLNGV
jgi:TP901 family phage tail tape measure protein